MRILIVEDEATGREILKGFLGPLGTCDAVCDGDEAVEAFESGLTAGDPYHLIMMDIMMPRVSGHEAMQKIRDIEVKNSIPREERVKIIMTTALGDQKNIVEAFFKGGAASYIVKPVEKAKLFAELKKLDLIE